jgi:hypothetical protein
MYFPVATKRLIAAQQVSLSYGFVMDEANLLPSFFF